VTHSLAAVARKPCKDTSRDTFEHHPSRPLDLTLRNGLRLLSAALACSCRLFFLNRLFASIDCVADRLSGRLTDGGTVESLQEERMQAGRQAETPLREKSIQSLQTHAMVSIQAREKTCWVARPAVPRLSFQACLSLLAGVFPFFFLLADSPSDCRFFQDKFTKADGHTQREQELSPSLFPLPFFDEHTWREGAEFTVGFFRDSHTHTHLLLIADRWTSRHRQATQLKLSNETSIQTSRQASSQSVSCLLLLQNDSQSIHRLFFLPPGLLAFSSLSGGK